MFLYHTRKDTLLFPPVSHISHISLVFPLFQLTQR